MKIIIIIIAKKKKKKKKSGKIRNHYTKHKDNKQGEEEHTRYLRLLKQHDILVKMMNFCNLETFCKKQKKARRNRFGAARCNVRA